MKYFKSSAAIVFFIFILLECQNSTKSKIDICNLPPGKGNNSIYVSTRPPLIPNPLIKLPIGSIKPQGWLLSQLELMRDGFIGHLTEISKFLKNNSGWLTGKGRGWEEMPYWLRGYGDIGYILQDQKMIGEAKKWIEAILSSQDKDGYFGPPVNKKNHDLWPNMVVLYILRSFYEATNDERILPFMSRYFRYQYNLPVEHLLPSSWQKFRGGENLESIYWLYNHTGEKFLLDLAERVYRRTHDWESPILTPERDKEWKISQFYHGVNITMGYRYPGIYYQQSGKKKYIEAVENNYRLIMDSYGQQPGGMFGADENIRPGKNDPRQGAETCSMVEFMNSNESLLKITGETRYADRCEEIAFNSLPASMTPDLKALHYLTAPNLISCDRSGEHDFDNSGDMLSFNPWRYRCCQHNVSFGWPYFAEHLWFATLDNGVVAVMYAPSTVELKVSSGKKISIKEETQYPFGDEINFIFNMDEPSEFSLYLRVPGWCDSARLAINGEYIDLRPHAGSYIRIKRRWKDSDSIKLLLPAKIEVKRWEKMKNSVSIRRGALWYSLKIGERWVRFNGTDEWPAFELLPTTPWNYALIIDPDQPIKYLQVKEIRKAAYQPFSFENAPIILKAKARRVGYWTAEGRMVGKLPQSPVKTSMHEEEIELIPMGCARLRISSFPYTTK